MNMQRALVIGYGNPLRQDDGLGLRAAEILEARGIPVLRRHQLTPELGADIAGADLVVFLDTSADLEPGAVRRVEVAAQATGAWTHHLTPGQLLSFVASIGACAPRAILITGGAFAMDYGEQLTEGGVQCALAMAAAALRAIQESAVSLAVTTPSSAFMMK